MFLASLQLSPSSKVWMDKIDWPADVNMEKEQFRERNNTMVLSRVGESITMDCRVERKGRKMVSLLTFSISYYTVLIYCNLILKMIMIIPHPCVFELREFKPEKVSLSF